MSSDVLLKAFTEADAARKAAFTAIEQYILHEAEPNLYTSGLRTPNEDGGLYPVGLALLNNPVTMINSSDGELRIEYVSHEGSLFADDLYGYGLEEFSLEDITKFVENISINGFAPADPDNKYVFQKEMSKANKTKLGAHFG